MLRSTILLFVLFTSFLFGQNLTWNSYTTDFQNQNINKILFNKDQTKLFILKEYHLFSYDLVNNQVDTLLYGDRLVNFFVDGNRLYVSVGGDNSIRIKKISISQDDGKTWNDVVVENMLSGFYVKNNIVYISRWYQEPSDWHQPPPSLYGIWTMDSLGNNLKFLYDDGMGSVYEIIGIHNSYIYYYGTGINLMGVYSTGPIPNHHIVNSYYYYFNEFTGDIYYKKYDVKDSLYKYNSPEVSAIPHVNYILFPEVGPKLAATDSSFYLKMFNDFKFLYLSENNTGKVNYMIEDKDGYVLLASNKGIFKSTFKLKEIAIVGNNEGKIELNNFNLSNNYPNPFNPSTKINFTVDQPKHIKLKVFDLLGKEVKVLVDEFKSAGSYDVDFNAADLPSGVYIYSLTDGKNIISKKMTLIK